ncbi:MAG: DUF1015 domain-containing protein, partial [Caldanaerobacter sp.]
MARRPFILYYFTFIKWYDKIDIKSFLERMRLMAIVKPFKALRPLPDLVKQVSSPPYDVLSREEAEELAKNNPYSFLHVERAEIDLEKDVNPYSDLVYEKARENFLMLKERAFMKEGRKCYYIYREEMKGREQTGLVALVSVDDYLKGIIKKHENTLPEKEEDRIKVMEYCNAYTSPVFLTYKSDDEIKRLINMWIARETPVYDFTSEDGVRHLFWVIDEVIVLEEIAKIFEGINSIYIADGHHRAAASVALGVKKRNNI